MKARKLFLAAFAMAALATAFSACEPIPGGDDPFTPDPGTGDTPEADTLTVAEAITNQDGTIQVVRGYVVGWFNVKPNPGECVFTNQAVADTTVNQANVLIADLATETDPAKVVCVQLPAGAVRDVANLGLNPGNLGKELIVKGKLTTYNLLPGIKESSYTEINGKKSTDPQSELLCYRTKDGVVSGQNLKVGDVVVLKTVLINYNGTYEANYGYFTAINGTVPEGAVTAAGSIGIAAGLQKSTNTTTDYHPSDSTFVTGTVTRIKDVYSGQYKNISYYIQ